MLIRVSVPSDSDRGPNYTEHILAALHDRMGRTDRVAFLIARYDGRVGLFVRFPRPLQSVILGGLHAYYPAAEIETLPDDALQTSTPVLTQSLHLRPDVFPLRRFSELLSVDTGVLVDPLSGVLHALTSDHAGRIELSIRPASKRRSQNASRIVETLHRPFLRSHRRLAYRFALAATSSLPPLRVLATVLGFFIPEGRLDATHKELTSSPDRDHEREGDIEAASDKVTGHPLFETTLTCIASADDPTDARDALATLTSSFAPFTRRRLVKWSKSHLTRRPFLLSTEEVSSLWHPPTGDVQTEQMSRSDFTQLEPPARLPVPSKENNVTLLGRISFRGRDDLFGVHLSDRLKHMTLIGKTGTGKSTLLSNLMLSDVEQGRGVALLDPHGDLCDRMLAAIPSHRTRDVVLLDASDTRFPVAFNVMDCPSRHLQHFIASGVVEIFKKLNIELSWGPRLEDLLRNACRLLLENQATTFISLERVLCDDKFRKDMTRTIHDPTIRSYWQNEFASWSRNERTIAVAAVLNKVRPFLSNPILRSIVGQAESKLNLREIIDDERILIVNLSKGVIGDDASHLLGSLLLTGLQIAAMSRADIPEDERRPFFAYIDEFQNFATRSFPTMLSESRKYGLGLCLAHQYLDQLDDETRAAVFGNVATTVCFRVSAGDAEAMAGEFGGVINPESMSRLPRYTAYVRTEIEGTPAGPFTMTTLPAAEGKDGDRSIVVRRTSNHRYARPASRVMREIEAAYA